MDNYKEFFARNYQLLGTDKMAKIKTATIAVVGIGGVGAACAEALVRTGFEKLTLVDMDIVESSNINRQRMATAKTIGKAKTDALAELLLEINPQLKLKKIQTKLCSENMNELITNEYDYVIDAIDMMSAKIELIVHAYKNNINIISSTGTANKIDPTKLCYGDIYQTSVDPIARILRRELKKRQVKNLDVIYSTEKPLQLSAGTPASLCFVPNAAGIALAAFVTQKIISPDTQD